MANIDFKQAESQLEEEYNQLADKQQILKSAVFKELYATLASLESSQRANYGRQINDLKQTYLQKLRALSQHDQDYTIDLTAPYDLNRPASRERLDLLTRNQGSLHPIYTEIELLSHEFQLMGFEIVNPREIDDDYHMFTALNFPANHPARDDYDSFNLTQLAKSDNQPLVAIAHTSSMQNRVLRAGQRLLAQHQPIACLIPGRVFRKEDVDARHGHTFYQAEGVYVDKNINIGNLKETLRVALEAYFKTTIEVSTQPYYFPFTEPSLEFNISCPFCQKAGCQICSYVGWLEIVGSGMIHPRVLELAGIDPNIYQGFAFGMGIDRLVMIKYSINDVRYFHSSRLDFLAQFSLAQKGISL